MKLNFKSIVITICILSGTTTFINSANAAVCTTRTINNFIEVTPPPVSTGSIGIHTFYSISDGDSYSYTNSQSETYTYTVNTTSTIQALDTDLGVSGHLLYINNYVSSVNGTAPLGSALVGNSHAYTFNITSGAIDYVALTLGDFDTFEGVRIVGYNGATVVTPTAEVDPTVTLTTLGTGEVQLVGNGTNTAEIPAYIRFGSQAIDRLVITNFKTASGNLPSSSYRLQALQRTCPPENVPASSTWSLILMTLLLLVISYSYRRSN